MRKLAWFAVFFAAAALFILLIPESVRLLLWLAPAGVMLLLVFLLRRSIPGSRLPRMLTAALIGFTLGSLYTLLWLGANQREMKVLLQGEQTVEAVVLEDSGEASYGLQTEVRIGRLRCSLFTDSMLPLEAGQRIRVRASFAATAEKSDYYLTRGVPLFGYARETPVILGNADAYWRFYPAKLGRLLRERIRELFDPESSAFLLAILTGDRSELRKDTHFYAMLRASGVSHCVAVSGMHLSFLVMLLYVLLGRGKLSALICIPLTLAFMSITGFTASVVRAGVMQLAVCGGKLFRKEYDSLSALGLALLVLVLSNPYCIRGAGLILSFSATLGILLFCEAIQTRLPAPPKKWGKNAVWTRLWRGVRASLAVSLSSGVLTVPANALLFRQFSLLAPLTNLLVLWAVSLCFMLGLMGVLLSFIHFSLGWYLRYPLGILTVYIRGITGVIGRFPLSTLYIRSPYLSAWICFTWGSILLYRFLPGLRRPAASFALTAAVSLAVFVGLSYLEPALDGLRFGMLDVGQGQCLVMTGPGEAVMIDCGGSLGTNAGDLAAEYLFSMGRFHVDTLILTHFHQDHVNGAAELLRRMPVGTLYCPRPAKEDTEAEDLLRSFRERGTNVVYVEEKNLWLQGSAMELGIVPPLSQLKENEAGLCIAVRAGDFSLLCTGDAGTSTELRLLERLRLENLTVLVAGHHGSANSVSPELLGTARPKAVLISAGRNSYGLPSERTLARIRNTGAAIYRTDENGNVILRYGQGEALWAN